jgi:hypothetical protein
LSPHEEGVNVTSPRGRGEDGSDSEAVSPLKGVCSVKKDSSSSPGLDLNLARKDNSWALETDSSSAARADSSGQRDTSDDTDKRFRFSDDDADHKPAFPRTYGEGQGHDPRHEEDEDDQPLDVDSPPSSPLPHPRSHSSPVLTGSGGREAHGEMGEEDQEVDVDGGGRALDDSFDSRTDDDMGSRPFDKIDLQRLREDLDRMKHEVRDLLT